MDLGRGKIKVTAERDPAKLPWKELGVDVALECTGIFTKRDKASLHHDAGAKRVLVSAPADGADITVVYGVNHDQLKPEHTRSEEHTSELQSLMRTSYAVFCLKKKKATLNTT